jgi:hypothetical protein
MLLKSERFTLSFHKVAIVFRMILIALIHISDTERNINVNIGKAVTRNTGFIGVVVTLGLRSAKELL